MDVKIDSKVSFMSWARNVIPLEYRRIKQNLNMLTETFLSFSWIFVIPSAVGIKSDTKIKNGVCTMKIRNLRSWLKKEILKYVEFEIF